MTTLRPRSSLWRRTRSTILAGTVALSSLLAPAVAGASSSTDTTGGGGFTISVSDANELSGLTAQISADGDTLNLRAEPTMTSAVVSTLSDGTIVELRIDVLNTVYDASGTRWWPVTVNGDSGWVSGAYLVEPGTSASTTNVPLFKDVPSSAPEQPAAATTSAFSWDGSSLTGATAQVSAGGDGLNLRATPAWGGNIVASIPDGTVVDLRIDTTDSIVDGDTRWWPVSFDGQDGWVSGAYLSDGADTSSSSDGTDTSSGEDGTSGATDASTQDREAFAWDGGELEGATAVVTASGDGATVYSEPTDGSNAIATVQDGASITLRIADVDTVVDADGVTRWWPADVDGANGWISGFNLSDGGTASPGSETPPDSQSSPVFASGSTALVQTESGQGLRVRSGAGMDSEQIFSVAEGDTVTVIDGPVSFENSVNGWFEISANGSNGFVDGDLLVLLATPVPTAVPVTPTPVPTDAPATEPATEPVADDTPAPEVTPTPVPTGDETESPLDDRPDSMPTQTPMVDETPVPTTEPEETPAQTPAPTQAPAGSSFIVPVEGATLTQNFGCSSLGFYPYNPEWGCGVHDGIDYAAPSGTPILASSGGTVTFAGWCDCGLGYYVEIDHGDGISTIYGHMAGQPYVSAGQQVAQGETIGPVGSTGLSTGPHVHFMLQVNGVSQDPASYLS